MEAARRTPTAPRSSWCSVTTGQPTAGSAAAPAVIPGALTTTVGMPAPQAAAATARPGALLVPGNSFDYQLVERTTQNARTVTLRVDRVDDRQVSFNNGA